MRVMSFDKDSTPVHCAVNTVQLLQCEILDFFLLSYSPPNSPESNPTDYKYYRVVQQYQYELRVDEIEEIKLQLGLVAV